MYGKFAELQKMDFTRLLYIASELHFWCSVFKFPSLEEKVRRNSRQIPWYDFNTPMSSAKLRSSRKVYSDGEFYIGFTAQVSISKKHLGSISEKSSVVFSSSSSKYSVSFLSVHIASFETWLFLFFRNGLMTFYKSLLTLKFGIF